MKLWMATVEIDLLIASEKKPSDMKIQHEASEEMRENYGGVSYPAVEITSLAEIPDDWRGSVPRGDAEYKTCEQIVNEAIDARNEAAMAKPMPNQATLPLAG